ncbi:hypothetical protein [Aquabacterium sp.]|uniref:hypothetical protein n=1 Tax=Aquabacterium sp. TaxID=1872578 RepID=UPI003D6D5187
MTSSKRNRRTLLIASALAIGLAGCASLMGPRTVEISREQLLAKLSKQFPMRKTLAEIFEIEAQAPRLQLNPDTNRVAAEFDIQATDRLFHRRYQGTVGVSFGMRYEALDRTIRLNQVSIDKVAIAGLSEDTQRQWTKVGAMLAQEKLQDYPIHQFKPEDLREVDRRGYQVEELRVTATGLSVQLVPKP